MSSLGKLVSDLQFGYKQPSPELKEVEKLFTKFQIALIKNYNSLKTTEDFVSGMNGLEYGAQLYVDARNGLKFERVFQQLSQFYSISNICDKSQDRQFLIGLYLMYLLTKNRLDDFHTQLELLNENDLKNEFIVFSMNVETYLMDGSYNKILSIKSSNHTKKDSRYSKFDVFLNDLGNTVRNEIADSLEAVHESMPLKDVLKMLNLNNVKTLENWINLQNAQANEIDSEEKGDIDIDGIDAMDDKAVARRNWSLNKESGTIVFVRQEQEQQAIEAMETAKDMLEFTGHIETIV